ncbi:hypothetical protein HGRIS_001689 [Hohenbuehelia grisea]|uniref:Uncharacterized protein n=1 Tax=Hohenbuehelia grisea TaxID=104357 RepID=A0ABR3JIV3_9AGAR
MGYLDVDIHAISSLPVVHRKSPLTPGAWSLMKSTLEKIVKDAKLRRIVSTRTDHLDAIYLDFKKTLAPPAMCLTLPPTRFLCKMPPFKALIEADVDGPLITNADFEASRASLPSVVDECVKLIRDSLKDAIEQACGGSSQWEDFDITAAALVFQCRDTECLAADYAPNWVSYGRQAKFQIGYEALGRDPKTATPEGLDQLNARLVCLQCKPYQKYQNHRVAGRQVYSWRGAIVHMHQEKSGHEQPSWAILNSNERAAVVKREYINSYQRLWACNHCSDHLDSWQSHAVVMDHLTRSHDIPTKTATPGLDYFRNPARPVLDTGVICPNLDQVSTLSTPRIPPGSTPSDRFHCSRCPSTQRQRTFIPQGIISHLKDKHRILKPELHKDYTPEVSKEGSSAGPSSHPLPTKPAPLTASTS